MSACSQGANLCILIRTTASGQASLTPGLLCVLSWICACGLETWTPSSQPVLWIPKAGGAGWQLGGAEL